VDKGAYDHAGTAHGATILIQLGRLGEAQALIEPTPLDCVPCIIARGDLAQAQGQRRLADHWYGEAQRIAPSFADASQRWGEVLAERGDPAGAIRRFQEAARRALGWADPMEGWGEALLAQGDAKAAVAKFKAAGTLAPNWGRLHLKWGEALAKLGKAEEAKAKFAAAARLDLTADDRAELARQQGSR
jgi:tetratricopeptide (TPR) repeat protein